MKPWMRARSAARQHRMRADQAGDDAAALDVADQHDRHVGRLGKAHIGDVAAPQVDLGRAAGAFDQDEVGLRAQAARSCPAPPAAARACAAGSRAPSACPTRWPCTITCAPVSVSGFSSTGFMCTRRRHAAGARLQRLRAADLAAVGRHGGVVRHVLRLERPHPQAASREGARTARRRAATCRHCEPVPWIINAACASHPERSSRSLPGRSELDPRLRLHARRGTGA